MIYHSAIFEWIDTSLRKLLRENYIFTLYFTQTPESKKGHNLAKV